MNQRETIALALVLRRLEAFDFSDTQNVVRVGPKSHSDQPPADVPLEKFILPIDGQQNVGDFIRERTKLYRESWLIPQLRAIVTRYAEKHAIRLDRITGS